jgi:chemotaxis protein methyltransferase CheR
VPVTQELASCRERAHSMADRGNFTEAAVWARRWLAIEGSSAAACYLLGVIEHALGHARPALDLLRRASYLDPNLPLVHFQMGVILAAEGRATDARACFSAALDLVKDAPERALLEGSDEITAGWLSRVLRARLRREEG